MFWIELIADYLDGRSTSNNPRSPIVAIGKNGSIYVLRGMTQVTADLIRHENFYNQSLLTNN